MTPILGSERLAHCAGCFRTLPRSDHDSGVVFVRSRCLRSAARAPGSTPDEDDAELHAAPVAEVAEAGETDTPGEAAGTG